MTSTRDPSVRAALRRRLVIAAIATGALVVGSIVFYVRWRRAAHREHEALLASEYVSYEGGSTRAIDPALAANARGDVAVAWMRIPLPPSGATAGAAVARVTADALGARFSADHGNTFRPIELVRSPGRLSADPSLATLPDGGFVLTWLALRADDGEPQPPHDTRIFAARADAGALHFGEPVPVTTDEGGRDYEHPSSVVTSRGAVLVAYRFTSAGTAGVAVAASTDGGRTWSRHDVLSTAGFAGGPVKMCTTRSSEDVYLTYFDPSRGIVLRPSHDGGATFPIDGERVASRPNEGVSRERPGCLVQGNDLVLAYGIGGQPPDATTSPSLSNVALVRSRDGGKTFDARADVTEPARYFLRPQLLAVESESTVTFVSYTVPAAPSGAVDLRFVRASFGSAAISVVLRSNLRIALRRDDPTWPGDSFGVATQADRTLVAYVDAVTSTANVAFVSGATPR